jgi:putative phosphoesterase
MRIGIISDTHDRTADVHAALDLLAERSVQLILHCGDIESIATVRLFAGVGLPTHFVFGNWDGDWISGVRCGWAAPAPGGRKRDDTRLRTAIAEIGGVLHEPWGELELAGQQVAWVHGNDRALLRDLEQCGCYDYLFYGHTHVAEQRRTGRTMVVNPGALFRVRRRQCAVLDVETGRLETVIVP